MYRIWIYIMLLVAFYSNSMGEEIDKVKFRQEVLAILIKKLEQPHPIFSKDIIDEVVKNTTLSEDDVRRNLLLLIDYIDNQRKEKTELWNKWIDRNKDIASSKKISLFLSHLVKESKKTVKKKNNFLLDKKIKKASEKASIPSHHSKELLLKILTAKFNLLENNIETFSIPIGLLVQIKDNLRKDSFFLGLFETGDGSEEIVNKLNIHEFLMSALLYDLPTSPSIKWTVQKPTTKLQPGHQLIFFINELDQRSGNTGKVVYYISGEIVIRLIPEKELFRKPLKIYYNPTNKNSKLSIERQVVNGFFYKIAQEIRSDIEGYLSH